MAFIFKAYVRVLQRHPLTTQALTAGILMGSGDAIAQCVIEKRSVKTFDTNRTTRFFVFGTVVVGPLLMNWYRLLDKVFIRPPPIGLVSKIAADQLLFAPSFLAFFLGSMTYWTTRNVDTTKQKIAQDYTSVLMANYKLWPIAQLINFYFVPLQYRVIYVSVIALGWNTYLAYKTSQ